MEISNTFSLVAIDPVSGYLGSAVASKYFAVGAVVPHLKRGVGVFNTQHDHNHRLAEEGLLLMTNGTHPDRAIRMIMAGDDMPGKRQLLAINVKGEKGVWTGKECVPIHHHAVGATCVAAGNTLAGPAVIDAMVAYMDGHREEPFGLRLIHALKAGQAEGGDRRGKQSAAVMTVPAALDICESNYVDMRIDDAEDPIGDLERLYLRFWQPECAPGVCGKESR